VDVKYLKEIQSKVYSIICYFILSHCSSFPSSRIIMSTTFVLYQTLTNHKVFQKNCIHGPILSTVRWEHNHFLSV